MIQAAPARETILGRLEPLTALVVRALVKATRSSREFFHAGRPFDPVLFATLVRYFTRLDLEAQRIHVSDDETPAFNAQSLPNIGLQITYDGFVLKILKSVDHLLPVPASGPKSEFYHQQTMFVIDEKTGDARCSELNLIYLWDCDKDHTLVEFQLACPKTGSDTRASVSAHWYEPLSIPAVAFATDDRKQHTVQNLDALEDLNISIAQDDAVTNRNSRQ